MALFSSLMRDQSSVHAAAPQPRRRVRSETIKTSRQHKLRAATAVCYQVPNSFFLLVLQGKSEFLSSANPPFPFEVTQRYIPIMQSIARTGSSLLRMLSQGGTCFASRGLASTAVSASGLIPMVVESSPRGERSFDIYSRLLRERYVTCMMFEPILHP